MPASIAAEQEGSVRLVGVVDPNTRKPTQSPPNSTARRFGSVEQMLTTHSEVQAVSVAVPTVLHLDVAAYPHQSGVDVLIEKPLASSQIEPTKCCCWRQTQTGSASRTPRALQPCRAPLLCADYAADVFSKSPAERVHAPSADVDVVLDLMIHDLDIVLLSCIRPSKEIRAVGLPILSGKVDIANVRWEFESGCVANFTPARFNGARPQTASLQPRPIHLDDYSRQDVLVFSVGDAGGMRPNRA